MKCVVWAFFLSGILAQAQNLTSIPNDVPQYPNPQLTPGSLCKTGSTYRYPEKIRYCDRDVESFEKEQVFFSYAYQYQMKKSYKRSQFKMDHFIPLCLGGSNEKDNLWPQHLSISMYTDKIEELLCVGMRQGRLKHANAIEMIKQAKRDLNVAIKMKAQLLDQYGP